MSGFRSIVISAAILAVPGFAAAQDYNAISSTSADTYTPYGWEADGTSRYSGGGELLGGPVRQPGEVQVGTETAYTMSAQRYDAGSADTAYASTASASTAQTADVRVVLTEAYRTSVKQQQSYVKPGTLVESENGLPLGIVQRVDRDKNGQVTWAWIKPPNSNTTDLQPVRVRSVTYANGEYTIVAG